MNIQESGPVKAVVNAENVEEMTWEADDSGADALAAQLKKIESSDEVIQVLYFFFKLNFVIQKDERWSKDHVEQVYGYLRFLEHAKEVRPNFLAHHGQNATPKMRMILVNWMVQVARRFRLLNETLFLTVAYMDRYLCFD